MRMKMIQNNLDYVSHSLSTVPTCPQLQLGLTPTLTHSQQTQNQTHTSQSQNQSKKSTTTPFDFGQTSFWDGNTLKNRSKQRAYKSTPDLNSAISHSTCSTNFSGEKSEKAQPVRCQLDFGSPKDIDIDFDPIPIYPLSLNNYSKTKGTSIGATESEKVKVNRETEREELLELRQRTQARVRRRSSPIERLNLRRPRANTVASVVSLPKVKAKGKRRQKLVSISSEGIGLASGFQNQDQNGSVVKMNSDLYLSCAGTSLINITPVGVSYGVLDLSVEVADVEGDGDVYEDNVSEVDMGEVKANEIQSRQVRSVTFSPHIEEVELIEDCEEVSSSRKGSWGIAPFNDEYWDGIKGRFRDKPLTPEELHLVEEQEEFRKGLGIFAAIETAFERVGTVWAKIHEVNHTVLRSLLNERPLNKSSSLLSQEHVSVTTFGSDVAKETKEMEIQINGSRPSSLISTSDHDLESCDQGSECDCDEDCLTRLLRSNGFELPVVSIPKELAVTYSKAVVN